MSTPEATSVTTVRPPRRDGAVIMIKSIAYSRVKWTHLSHFISHYDSIDACFHCRANQERQSRSRMFASQEADPQVRIAAESREIATSEGSLSG